MADLVDRNKSLIQYGGLNTLLLRLESYLEISRIAGSESWNGLTSFKPFRAWQHLQEHFDTSA